MTPNVDTERGNLQVSVSEFRGQDRLDVRHLWEKDGEWRPTKKGVNVPLDEAPIVIEAMIEAYNKATGQNLSLQQG